MTMVTGQGQNNNQKVMQCTLITGVYYSTPNNLPSIKANGYKGFQLVVDLQYLPPGVSLSALDIGQEWWCEFRTGKWTLWKSIGEFTVLGLVNFTTQNLPTVPIQSQGENSLTSDISAVSSMGKTKPIPSSPSGYFEIMVNGQLARVPYYS